MTCQVVLNLNNGTIIRGLNYRMDPAVAAAPAASAGFNGGEYHIQTARGWVDVPVIQTNPPPPQVYVAPPPPNNPALTSGGLT
jgi:hypothetical protein